MPLDWASVTARMDRLNEFDREPVPPYKMQSGGKFAGLYAGEHIAATEFVIGAFLVLHGVGARDLMLGLALGNLLAVLSWTFVCAPIATRTRLTLYWYLRRIAGPGMSVLYNVATALTSCVIAAAMISVTATAVGLPFGVPAPVLTDIAPPGVTWVLIALALGTAITVLAILGFEKLAKFAELCSPWLVVVFLAGGIAALPGLGVSPDFSNFWEIASTRIWTGTPVAGQEQWGLWHVVFFTWFCNMPMHVGLTDMAMFRFARTWKFGLYTATGMFLGHFLAWACSGVMVAAVNREMNPGMMAFQAVGWAGPVAVLLAGWTTANPTLYRAGLALQCATPNWARWKVTMIAGGITTLMACFPLFTNKLDSVVALNGIFVMPIGAIVLAEHWIFPRLGIPQYQAETARWLINWRVLLVWLGTVFICIYVMGQLQIGLLFRSLPGYLLALGAYTVLQAVLRPRATEVQSAAGSRH